MPSVVSLTLKEKKASERTRNAAANIETSSGGEVRGGSGSTLAGADLALNSTQNAVRIYDNYFGKLPYTRVAMTQQPAGFFGQAWPTLIYMPYTAFLDPTQRRNLFGSSRAATDTFWQYVGPHEVAHQWWGHVIGWTSYRDQWMSEGFSEFSASLRRLEDSKQTASKANP